MSERLPAGAYCSLTEAAEFLGVSERFLRAEIARGYLVAYRLGGRTIRVRRADVEAMPQPIPAVGPLPPRQTALALAQSALPPHRRVAFNAPHREVGR